MRRTLPTEEPSINRNVDDVEPPSLMSASRPDNEISAESRLTKRHGSPQWIPELRGNLSDEGQYQGIGDRIDDVVLTKDRAQDHVVQYVSAEGNDPIRLNRLSIAADEQRIALVPDITNLAPGVCRDIVCLKLFSEPVSYLLSLGCGITARCTTQ